MTTNRAAYYRAYYPDLYRYLQHLYMLHDVCKYESGWVVYSENAKGKTVVAIDVYNGITMVQSLYYGLPDEIYHKGDLVLIITPPDDVAIALPTKSTLIAHVGEITDDNL